MNVVAAIKSLFMLQTIQVQLRKQEEEEKNTNEKTIYWMSYCKFLNTLLERVTRDWKVGYKGSENDDHGHF